MSFRSLRRYKGRLLVRLRSITGCSTVQDPRTCLGRLFKNLVSKVLASGDSAEQLLKVSQQYGKSKRPIFRQQSLTATEGPQARIGRKHLITSIPAVTYTIVSTSSGYKRAEWFDALRIDPHVKN